MHPASSPSLDTVLAFLGAVDIFRGIRPDYLQHIAQRGELCSLQREQIIFEEGVPPDAVYIVESGTVGLFRVESRYKLLLEQQRLRPGQIFGETALLSDKPRSSTSIALQPTICVRFQRAALSSALGKIPELAIALGQHLAERVSRHDREPVVPAVELMAMEADTELVRLVPSHLLEHHKMVPLAIQEGILTVGCLNVTDFAGLDALRRAVRCIGLKPVALREADYQRFIERNARPTSTSHSRPPTVRVQGIRFITDETIGMPETTRGEEVKQLVDRIVSEGLEREASDIHIEPEREGVVVRYRVSGRLQRSASPPIPRNLQRAIASRFKVLAELDISEKRLPQDGRISLEAAGRIFDLRISSLPTHDGEKLVLRILDSAKALQPLDRLIVADDVCAAVQQMISRPHGVVYVCGPTGSGKTTTLYAAVGARRREDTNITTAEDPVEYQIPGVTQVNISADIGLTFATVLRSILRQDPNVILVGETRDTETGKLVVEAGLTGHLVLTSLHTNDALGTIQRLREMGLDNFAISASLVGILSQRLVRQPCNACAYDAPISVGLLEQLVLAGVMAPDFKGALRRSRGCGACGNGGYKGRIASYELLVADDALRQRITANAALHELREVARKGFYVPMANYSNFLLTNGMTTPEEILPVHTGALR